MPAVVPCLLTRLPIESHHHQTLLRAPCGETGTTHADNEKLVAGRRVSLADLHRRRLRRARRCAPDLGDDLQPLRQAPRPLRAEYRRLRCESAPEGGGGQYGGDGGGFDQLGFGTLAYTL
jgi:hypothetical protein